MTDRVKKLVEFIKEKNLVGMQTFNTRNIFGDGLFTIYNKDGITLDYCYYYGYLELFGLSDDEYNSLSEVLDIV